ncbi:MAG: NfeD family protein [Gammaproteobacteria bacterium]|nr:NfeD family protein [Gammaproteobacteria bacterium]
MPWWGWMIFGAFLLGSELLGVEAGFYLVFIGLAAVMTGFLEVFGLELDPWIQWVIFSVLGLMLMVLFRKKLYEKLRGDGVGYDSGPAGDYVEIAETLSPGGKGRLSYRGTDWTVINEGSEAVEKGSNVRISSVNGLTLIINQEDKNDS